MLSKIKWSLGKINYRLYFALLALGLCPTIYTTVRVFFLGQLPGEWSYSIAGQLSWINLLYEIMNEAIILPLFYFIGKVKDDKEEFSNRVRTGMFIAFVVYIILSAFVIIFANPLLRLMATDISIIKASSSYIRIESVAHIFSILSQFVLVALVTVNKSKYLYLLTVSKSRIKRFFDCVLSEDFSFKILLIFSARPSLGLRSPITERKAKLST